jgi:hypothetical protein
MVKKVRRKKAPKALWRSTSALRDYGVMKWRVASNWWGAGRRKKTLG